jgi:hypothetical protein
VTPLGPRVDGKDHRGRFAPGNKLGRGNPLAARAAKIRAKLLTTKASDVDVIVRQLIDGAKRGDLAFIREFLDRTIGKPSPIDPIEIHVNNPPAKPPFDHEAFAALWRSHWPEPEPPTRGE